MNRFYQSASSYSSSNGFVELVFNVEIFDEKRFIDEIYLHIKMPEQVSHSRRDFFAYCEFFGLKIIQQIQVSTNDNNYIINISNEDIIGNLRTKYSSKQRFCNMAK